MNLTALSTLPANQTSITLTLNGDAIPVVEMAGEEKLSCPFSFTLECLVDKYLPLDRVIGASGQLRFTGKDNTTHIVTGIINYYEDIKSHTDGRMRAKLHLVSGLMYLQQHSDTRVILGLSVPDIIRATCERHGFNSDQLQFNLSQTYAVRPYVIQAQETDLAFIQRLLGREGIFFYSQTRNGYEILVFTDHNAHCPYLNRPALEFFPPSGLTKRGLTLTGIPHVGLHSLNVHYHRITSTHKVRDHTENNPGTTLRGETDSSATVVEPQPSYAEYYGRGSVDMLDAERLSRSLAEWAQSTAVVLIAQGNVVDITAGYTYTLDATQFDAQGRHSGDWLITGVSHTASQHDGQQTPGENLAYRNTHTAIRREVPFRPPLPEHPQISSLFSARIESDGPYARLDEQGRYQLRNLFDISHTASTQASIPLRRLQPVGGPPGPDNQATGFHAPLQHGDDVLLSCLNGDPNRPMIVAGVANANRPSPVTSRNFTKNRLRTAADNELCMDDEKGKEYITLRTYAGHNLLQLNADVQDQRARLVSEQGSQVLWTKKTHQLQSGDTLTERVGNDRFQIVENQHQTTTNKKEIHYQAKTYHKHTAHKNLRTESDKNTELSTGKNLHIDVVNNAKLTLRGSDGLRVTVRNGNVTFNAAKDIRIAGKGGGDITLEQRGGGFKVKANGDVALYGNKVELKGKNGVNFNGSVNYNIGSPNIPSEARVKPPLASAVIKTLLDNGGTARPTNVPWLGLQYTYHDGEPVKGADFTLTFSDGTQKAGKLGADGTAHLNNVPAGPFQVAYSEDERDWQPKEKEPPQNKHYQATFTQADPPVLKKKLAQDPSLLDEASEAVSDVGSWLWGTLQGDFNQEMSTSQIVVSTVVTMIPGLDQLADVRDITANVITLSEEKEREKTMNWVILAITLIGLFPILGSALKGIFKILIKHLDTAAEPIFAILRKIGYGNPQRFLKNLDWADMTKKVQDLFQDALGRIKAALNYVRESKVVTVFTDNKTLKQLDKKLKQIDELASMGNRKLEEAMEWLKSRLNQLLNKEDISKQSRGETDRLNPTLAEERATESNALRHSGKKYRPPNTVISFMADDDILNKSLEKRYKSLEAGLTDDFARVLPGEDELEWVDIIAHGTPDGIYLNTPNGDVLLDYKRAAEFIKFQPGYNGENIRLIACNTAGNSTSGNISFASDLAQHMDIKVKGATATLWSDRDTGLLTIAPRSASNPNIDDPIIRGHAVITPAD